mgnify:CR=1 FL=1|tara:strand:- start:5843 stop:6364 length:522 start_codon:yes stop_codon:yes gene_type:complete
MITYKDIIEIFVTIANKHFQINSVHSGFLDEVDITKLNANNYPILYVEPGTVNIDRGSLSYTMTIYCMDMINDIVGPTTNHSPAASAIKTADRQYLGRIDTYSEQLRILQDVIAQFRQNLNSESVVDDQIVLQLPINAEPFTARFNNLLTGYSADLVLQVNNENNLCIIPSLS